MASSPVTNHSRWQSCLPRWLRCNSCCTKGGPSGHCTPAASSFHQAMAWLILTRVRCSESSPLQDLRICWAAKFYITWSSSSAVHMRSPAAGCADCAWLTLLNARASASMTTQCTPIMPLCTANQQGCSLPRVHSTILLQTFAAILWSACERAYRI